MKANELLQLSEETKRFLDESLPIQVKFRLNKFLKETQVQVQAIFDSRNELILQIEPSGNIPSKLEDGTVNPKLQEFEAEFTKVLNEEVEVTIPAINIGEISLTTTNNYPLLFEKMFVE